MGGGFRGGVVVVGERMQIRVCKVKGSSFISMLAFIDATLDLDLFFYIVLSYVFSLIV